MDRLNSEELTLITSFPTQLIQGVNYPGEAQYLSLVPGLGGEVWYDDGAFTGLTKLMLKDFLDLAPMASHVHRFQQNNGTCAFRFLLDQQNRHLFIGPQDAVSVSLQRNARPRVPNWFAGEQTLCHEPSQC